MTFIDYINDTLAVENVTVSSIAKSVGTPFYCYSTKLMLQQYRALEAALKSHDATIYYAVKANSNLAVIKTFSAQGAGADVVSLGELQRCLLAGVPANKIVFAGVGKTREEISEALKRRCFST